MPRKKKPRPIGMSDRDKVRVAKYYIDLEAKAEQGENLAKVIVEVNDSIDDLGSDFREAWDAIVEESRKILEVS